MTKIKFFLLMAAPTALVFLMFQHKLNQAQQLTKQQAAEKEMYKRLYLEANGELIKLDNHWLWQNFKAAHENDKP